MSFRRTKRDAALPAINRRGRGHLAAISMVLITLIVPAEDAVAACTDVLLADGFEIGDTSLWSNSSVPARATGTWLFSLDFTGSVRSFALELIERPGGAVTGYLLGGTPQRTFVTGSVTGSTLGFELQLIHPAATRVIQFSGTLGRQSVVGTASGDIQSQAVSLERTFCELHEQEMAAAVDTGGSDPEHLRVISVVMDEDGGFVGGGWVGQDDCDLWACDGGVSSFEEAGDTVTVGLETDGGCSAGSSFTATWDPIGLYFGGYTFTDCGGTTSGDMLAAFAMTTTSRAAREILGARVSIAAALEAGVPLTQTLNAVSPGYLNFGKDEPALRAELNDEMSRYTDIEVELRRAREIRTGTHPRTLPDLIRPMGLTIGEIRSGVPVSEGVEAVRYRDTDARPIVDDFGVVGEEDGVWKVVGNQVPGVDLPWAYTIPPGGSRLEAPTADANPVYVSIGPFGAHFMPLTGDVLGEGKANFVGFLVEGDSEMEELVGNGNGIREPGEVWGYPVGGDVTGNRIRQRRPVFIAPLDGEVREVIYSDDPSGVYFDDEPHWELLLGQPGDVRLAFGHLGKIAPELRSLVLAVTGVDTDTFAGPPGTDLLAGHDSISVPAGTELALPQILADPVPGFPGYHVGGGSFLEYPWAQMEYKTPFHLGAGSDLGSDFCVYRFVSGATRDELQAAMDVDMLDPDSLRYRDRGFTDRWQWSAQGGLCQAENMLPRGFSDLYTRLGGWSERLEAGTTSDEIFSWVPIDTSSAAYDPLNYHSGDVATLVVRNQWPGPFSWQMPDGTTATVWVPVGEVLDRSVDSLLIKWRDFNQTNPEVFQRAAYRLDENGLTVEWGNFAATPGSAVPPVLSPGEPCDDTAVLCYDHSEGAWPPLQATP